MEEKKPIKLEQKHWIIIAAACFVAVLTLVLCLAFCGKDNGSNAGEGPENEESETLDPGGTYDEEGNFTGAEGTVDPNWDVND